MSAGEIGISVDERPWSAQADWQPLIGKLNGTPYHLPEVWLPGTLPDDIRCLVFTRGGESVAAVVGIVEREYLFRRVPKGRSLHLPTAPAVKDDGLRATIYEALLTHARAAGYRHLSIDPRWGDDFSGHPVPGDKVEDSIIEFTVGLAGGIEGASRGMHKKHRKNVRVAVDAGVLLEGDDSLGGLLRLREMQTESAERGSRRGNPFSVQGEEMYRELHAKIYQPGIGRVLLARRGEEYLAGLAYLVFGRKAVTVRSGSTTLGYELSAMYLLQYELFRILAGQGVEELNIGGVPACAQDSSHPQHGLYNYKRYYGGSAHLSTGVRLRL